MDFKQKGDVIYLLGESRNDINSSQYLKSYHKVHLSPPPYYNADKEFILHHTLSGLISSRLINSAHDLSEGGLFIALLESGLNRNLGFDITTDCEIREDAFLFGEAQGRVIVSVSPENEGDFVDFMMSSKVTTTLLGHVTKGEMRIDDVSYGFVKDAKTLYSQALETLLGES
jgi:phosphoribosylformylglycinamidine synthase subunit PurL